MGRFPKAKATIRQEKMIQCIKCLEGEPEVGVTSLVYERKGSAIQVKVEGIPAEICPACGEVYLSEAVAQQIYDLVSPLLEVGKEMAAGSVLPPPVVTIHFPPIEANQWQQLAVAV
jgi:YgiT-type zinc finger domain-containing protein